MRKDFYIYTHSRLSDGQVFYVGKGRGRRARSTSDRSEYWHKTAAKHGYVVEIVECGLQEWYAFEREVELIALHREKGSPLTNHTDGGEGVSGYMHTDVSKRRMGETSKSLWNDEEYRKNHIKAMHRPDVVEHRKAVHSSDEYRKNHGEAMRRLWNNSEHKIARKQLNKKVNAAKRKPVRCVQTTVKFLSVTQACEWLRSIGFTSAAQTVVSQTCAGVRKTAYGFNWSYV
jgi:hypothetical protein